MRPSRGGQHDPLGTARVDHPGEGFHPTRPRPRPHWRAERGLHHFVSHPAKEEGIRLDEVLDRMTMQVFVRDDATMIAASVQGDVDGITQGSHQGGRKGQVVYCPISSMRDGKLTINGLAPQLSD